MDNDRRREALRVRFTADGEADASEVGGGEGGKGGVRGRPSFGRRCLRAGECSFPFQKNLTL